VYLIFIGGFLSAVGILTDSAPLCKYFLNFFSAAKTRSFFPLPDNNPPNPFLLAHGTAVGCFFTLHCRGLFYAPKEVFSQKYLVLSPKIRIIANQRSFYDRPESS
jgi:hypothetical protein